MSELSSAEELAINYAHQLQAREPRHELLKYFSGEENSQLDEEFETRFWNKNFPSDGQPGHLVDATIWANFAAALKQALEQRPPALTQITQASEP